MKSFKGTQLKENFINSPTLDLCLLTSGSHILPTPLKINHSNWNAKCRARGMNKHAKYCYWCLTIVHASKRRKINITDEFWRGMRVNFC